MEFTKEELFYIERTADIESSLILSKFFQFVSIPSSKFSKEELEFTQKLTGELIESYLILKGLRIKLERERSLSGKKS